ncbi:MAG: hypothetical protein CMM52_13630 [Rhodospirillaceae bacterium]|nr:hypothetical protein [Rhodospirillaceae bacterium]|tara:strand:+ start:18843 stop:19442 length:600 start_codon:yes stop_codon:yes gene_type:complete
MKRSPVLIMFARAPYLGTVKKRLAAGIGPIAARKFYVETATAVMRAVSKNAYWRTVISITPDMAVGRGRYWCPGIEQIPQGFGDLGDRMERALLQFSDRPVAIIGSDIPEIENQHIRSAFRALGQSDLVFGPSPDGGYWLVGARKGRLARGLFKNVRWSSEHTLSDTLRNAGNRRARQIAELGDIDDVNDLTRWQAQRS